MQSVGGEKDVTSTKKRVHVAEEGERTPDNAGECVIVPVDNVRATG